jgi:hypothetical protein
MEQPKLMATMWPSFGHFPRFARDSRLSWGIRINSAMMSVEEMAKELALCAAAKPLFLPWWDAKGRQLRIEWVDPSTGHLELRLNHAIRVETATNPVPVLFKGGNDGAQLVGLAENGRRLIFADGPKYHLNEGESLHIRHPSLTILDSQFTPPEVLKLEVARSAGFKRYCLSYAQSQRDVDEFLEIVGRDCEVILKIEDQKGLEFVAREFRKRDGLMLMAAAGDLYVELERPHQIMAAHRLIISKDPQAFRGSRLLLSVVAGPVPDCADFVELAWLWDIGFRHFMFCDEICLNEEALDTAISALIVSLEDYDRLVKA